MEINTTRFGKVEVPAEDLITFPDGIIGFPGLKQFALIAFKGDAPFIWLQSTEDPDLAFAVTDPWLFAEDYDFFLSKTARARLSVSLPQDEKNVRVLAIATIPAAIAEATLNLKGPLVINRAEKIGLQVVIQEDYSSRYRIFKEVMTSA